MGRLKDTKAIYVSSKIHDQEETQESFTPGLAHYSYKLARNKFEHALVEASYSIESLSRPEIYSSPESVAALPFGTSKVPHLIFKPFEHIRVLKGAINIACLAWEFDKVLTSSTVNNDLLPTHDYVRMAAVIDEIWTPSIYAKDVFMQFGISNVEVIPAPIRAIATTRIRKEKAPEILLLNLAYERDWLQVYTPRAKPYRYLSSVINDRHNGQKPKIFLMVFNPGDRRKNPGSAIRAFLAFNSRYPDSLLIIKFVFHSSLASIQTIVRRDIAGLMGEMKLANSNAVWMTDEFLPKLVFDDLVRFSDFFLCTSYCEGQNLPLLESMSAGVVPVSVSHTAMADYISEQNAIVIPSKLSRENIHTSFASSIFDVRWYATEDLDVYKALERAHNMGPHAYEHLSMNAKQKVDEVFSPARIIELIENRFQVLADGH